MVIVSERQIHKQGRPVRVLYDAQTHHGQNREEEKNA